MKIHEYQAKEILARYGLKTPKGYVTDNPEEAKTIYEKIGTKTVVVKAQIHAGGRGKGGGVKLAHSAEETYDIARKILGMQLVTPQTGPEGKKVLKILIEEGMPILKEYYASITLDRRLAKPILMVSEAGGMDIEEVAKHSPDKILTEVIEPCLGLQRWQANRLAWALKLPSELIKDAVALFMGLWRVYHEEDCSLVEINPLVTTQDGRLLPLDAKITFDDNALFRHNDHLAMRDVTEEDPLEVEASKYKLNYVRLNGNVGCMVNGAGLAMATMDIIKHAGAFPANFLDVGGGANVETVTNGFRIILSDPNVKGIFVNIFGGIVRCDRIAGGIIQAAKNVSIKVPLVVRLAGTNAEEARQMLLKSGISLEVAENLREGAQKIVKLIQK
ncbi:MAG: ADP-forming succinate--CoA ligase subunit beta [Leptospiraceae bacterium]|nr:ADP-forming succinate--CoA ligase subunit beta [Leptospiraceae bacterium]MDW8307099.1 ADP-forming succinate--CoA ligase subunit beta [Leptospiraceae bacterium]